MEHFGLDMGIYRFRKNKEIAKSQAYSFPAFRGFFHIDESETALSQRRANLIAHFYCHITKTIIHTIDFGILGYDNYLTTTTHGTAMSV